MAVGLFLMTKKGLYSLKAILEHDKKDIAFVVVGEDKSVQNDYSKDIKELCLKHDLVVFDRKAVDNCPKASYYLAVSWRWLIDAPKDRLFVIHDSLLPRYRGFNPLVSCLINKETRIGASLIVANKDYDSGPILNQMETMVSYPVTISEAIDSLLHIYKELSLDFICYVNGHRPEKPKPQTGTPTYSLWRDIDDRVLDWDRSAAELKRTVDALGYPYKGALALDKDEGYITIHSCEEVPDVKIENRKAGKVIRVEDGLPTVVCGKGLLKIISATDQWRDISALPLKKFRTQFCLPLC